MALISTYTPTAAVQPLATFPEFKPQPKQQAFLSSTADIAVYGGAAGGGKSWALLYDPLQFIDVPGFNAVIFRRTSPEITNPGGLWDEACGLYPFCCGEPKVGNLEWRFPWGTKVALRHLQHEEDKISWHGAQICMLGFDELGHFTESQFWYLTSRNRSMCGVRPYVRATCNPTPGWLKETILSPWVNDEFKGKKAESGEIRWFIREDGKLKWVDKGTYTAKSITFIRSTIYDNPALLNRDEDYLNTLNALLPVERARLLDGDWNVRREGLVYPGFDACIVESVRGDSPVPEVGGIDFGFHNPFAAVWGHVDGDDVLWITGLHYKSGWTTPQHGQSLPMGARWWCDPAQPGIIHELVLSNHECLPCVHLSARGNAGSPRSPVLAGIDQVTERIRTGRLKIVRERCRDLIRELSNYHYDELKLEETPVKEADHACDALRYLVVGLDRGRAVPRIEAEPTPESDLMNREGWH